MEVVKEHYLLHSFTFRFQVNYNETTLLTVLVFLPNMKLSSFFSLLGISCLLIFEWIRNALLFFGPSFFHIYTCLFSDVFPNMKLLSFSAYLAFCVYSSLSGFGMPYFFLVCHFFTLTLVYFLMFFQT